MIAVALLPAILLFLASAGVWRGHMYELRWVVAVCVAGLCVAARRDSLPWFAILLNILILINPLFPLRFTIATMRVVEAVAGICLLVRGLSRV